MPCGSPTIRRSGLRRRSAPAMFARAHRVAAAVKAGIVWINDHHRLDPASPWGGVDDSGIGREFGTESFDDHFNTKSVMVATHDQPFDWYRDTAAQRRLN